MGMTKAMTLDDCETSNGQKDEDEHDDMDGEKVCFSIKARVSVSG